jgi:hypothetical protein
MSRSSRDERETPEQEPLGRMLLSEGRGGGTSNNVEPKANSGTENEVSLLPEIGRPQTLGREREPFVIRDRTYQISARELVLMSEVGKFRTIAVTDLAEYRYGRAMRPLSADIGNLRTQKLVSQRRIMAGKGREKFSVLVLTKEGKRILVQEQTHPFGQAFYSGLVKPQEVAHDAAIYRMYQVEAAKLEEQGARIHRVVLDFELKKKVYSPLAKARPGC